MGFVKVTACRPLIFDAVVECLLGGSDSSVLEAACRLVCTISAKNSETQAHVLADARILSKILGEDQDAISMIHSLPLSTEVDVTNVDHLVIACHCLFFLNLSSTDSGVNIQSY